MDDILSAKTCPPLMQLLSPSNSSLLKIAEVQIWLIAVSKWTNTCWCIDPRFLVLVFICQSRMTSTSACASWASTVSLKTSLLSSLCCFMRRWHLKRQVFTYHQCAREMTVMNLNENNIIGSSWICLFSFSLKSAERCMQLMTAYSYKNICETMKL